MRTVLALLLCLGLVGCATFAPTPYVKAGRRGYSDFRISEDVFTVNFSGNAKCSPDYVQKMALIRASELTLMNDFTHFTVIESTPSQRMVMLPTTIGFGSVGTQLPSITLKIKCFKGERPEEAIDAQEFLDYNFPELKKKGG